MDKFYLCFDFFAMAMIMAMVDIMVDSPMSLALHSALQANQRKKIVSESKTYLGDGFENDSYLGKYLIKIQLNYIQFPKMNLIPLVHAVISCATNRL